MSESTAYVPKEWPKYVKGRIARDARHALSILSHAPDCQTYTPHPDADHLCSCGGKKPTQADLIEAGLQVPKARSSRSPKKPSKPRKKKTVG